jgi:hypothetical protein
MSARPDATPIDVARMLVAPSRDGAALRALGRQLSGHGRDAVRLWHLLRHGGLAPLAAVAFDALGDEQILAPRVRESLRSALEVTTLRNALLRRAAIDATRALTAAAIPVLWTKGLWLAHYVYDAPGLRAMADIDLVVPLGRRPDAVAVLESIGFRHVPATEPGGAAAWADALTRDGDLPGDDAAVWIDLHDALRITSAHAWPVEHLWDGARHVRVSATDVRLPQYEAGLLYVAVHLLKHGLDLRHALVATADAAAILRRAGDALDEDWLGRQLEDAQQATALYLLLSLVGRVPDSGGSRLFDSARARLARLGALRRADRLLAACEHATLSSATDFSMFDLAQQRSLLAMVRTLARSAGRWRRRVTRSTDAIGGTPGLTLIRANWGYAYQTWLAGRLTARVSRDTHRS